MNRIINDLCIKLNKNYPVSRIPMVEVDTVDLERTKTFAKWFKLVICLGTWTEDEIYDYCKDTYDYGNIMFGNIRNMKDIEENSKCFVFLNKTTDRNIFDWENKIIKGGYIAGMKSGNIWIKGVK